MEEIINLGKIPSDDKFRFKRSLQILMLNNKEGDKDKILQSMEEHSAIVKEIEQGMNLSAKICNYDADNWKFTIDDDYNFWIMTKEYVDKHFINRKED